MTDLQIINAIRDGVKDGMGIIDGRLKSLEAWFMGIDSKLDRIPALEQQRRSDDKRITNLEENQKQIVADLKAISDITLKNTWFTGNAGKLVWVITGGVVTLTISGVAALVIFAVRNVS